MIGSGNGSVPHRPILLSGGIAGSVCLCLEEVCSRVQWMRDSFADTTGCTESWIEDCGPPSAVALATLADMDRFLGDARGVLGLAGSKGGESVEVSAEVGGELCRHLEEGYAELLRERNDIAETDGEGVRPGRVAEGLPAEQLRWVARTDEFLERIREVLSGASWRELDR